MSTPGIVLVHGLHRDPASWEDIRARAHAAGARTAVACLPGHGARAGEPFTRAGAVAAVAAAVAELAPAGPVLLVGHSLGGLSALDYAAAHPAGADGLVLSACLSQPRGKPLRLYGQVGGSLVDVAARSRAWARRSAPPAESSWTLVRQVLDAWAGASTVTALAQVPVPVTLVTGRWDPMRIDQARFRAARPDARLVVLPRAGHDSFEQGPAAFWGAVEGAWLGLPARALPVPAARAA